MGISYNFIRILVSEKIDIQPAFFAIFCESNTAGDCFIIALHVEVVADVGIILSFVGIAFAASHESFFIFPHHLEESIGCFSCSFAPRGAEVRTRILCTFAAIAKVTVSLVFGEVISGFLIGTGLLFFRCKRQRFEIFCRTVFVDFRKAIFTPGFAEKGLFRGRRRRPCRGRRRGGRIFGRRGCGSLFR